MIPTPPKPPFDAHAAFLLGIQLGVELSPFPMLAHFFARDTPLPGIAPQAKEALSALIQGCVEDQKILLTEFLAAVNTPEMRASFADPTDEVASNAALDALRGVLYGLLQRKGVL
jgi:hypothetical protein